MPVEVRRYQRASKSAKGVPESVKKCQVSTRGCHGGSKGARVHYGDVTARQSLSKCACLGQCSPKGCQGVSKGSESATSSMWCHSLAAQIHVDSVFCVIYSKAEDCVGTIVFSIWITCFILFVSEWELCLYFLAFVFMPGGFR